MASRRAFLLAAALVCAAAAGAVAQPAGPEPPRPQPASAVALLPLDARGGLEIYGQAVATEIARALMAGGIEVVVVGANMDVPANARLIIDGSISTDKGIVSLSLRVRNPADGTVLDPLAATAPGLAQIDKAAAELSARVLPVVRRRLTGRPQERPGGGGPVRPLPPGGGPAARLVLVAVTGRPHVETLRVALAGSVEGWARAARREPRVVEPRELDGKLPAAAAAAKAERAIMFEVLGYSVRSARDVPLARARVRVRISDDAAMVFDRVVTTDTVVGERQMPSAELAARVAEEVLAILRPHMRRVAEPWR